MLISKARFVKNAEEKFVSIAEVSKDTYDHHFRGFLYCPTPSCSAKVVYINSASAHFRTWQYHSHNEGCMYHFERRWVERDFQLTDVTIGYEFEQRQMALNRAYQSMRFPEEYTPLKSVAIQIPTRFRKKTITGEQISLFDENTLQSLKRKRLPLRRKYVSKINGNDIGKQKLVMGYIKNVDLKLDVAKITLFENEKEIDIVFEDAFIEEEKNKKYLNKFGVIQQFEENNPELAFAGIGEVRFNRKTNRFEHQIFFGTDFRIENMDLLVLSSKMTLNGKE